MKNARMIIGIISIVLCLFVLFQSCAAGISNTLQDNGEAGGSGGVVLAIFMLVAGIVGIAGRKSKAPSIVAGGFYAAAAIIGFATAGSYADLKIWSSLCLAFAILFIVSGIVQKNNKDISE